MSNKETAAEAAPITRDSVRSAIFANAGKYRKETLSFFGTEIELRQPSLGAIIEAKEAANSQNAIINTLIRYAYVPGTNVKVFEDADEEALRELPFGGDFIEVTKKLEVLTEVNFLGQKST